MGMFLALAAAIAAAPPIPATIDESRLIDLTYSFDEDSIYWPTAKPFEWSKETWERSPAGDWYAAGRYAASEHGGTHLDAPIHFAEGRMTIDSIPISKLVGPAVVIDVRAGAARNPDYLLTTSDLEGWERRNGRIPDGAIVLIHTGWGRYWGDRKAYLGTDAPGDTANLHFPGISKDAAQFLATRRRIDAIGIDTASLDHGPSKHFDAHRVLNGANIYGLENVANLDRLPTVGATVIALPMKIRGGSGGPTRIIALLPEPKQ